MASDQTAILAVLVKPRSFANRVMGEKDGVILVQVKAAPVDGAANQAVIETLRRALGVPRGHVSVVRGRTARNKGVAVTGITMEEARKRLGLG